MLRYDLCYFNDAYIVAKGNITHDKKIFTANDFEVVNNTADNATATNTANDNAFNEKKLVFKNNAPFINRISKINGLQIDSAEDLDVVMPMYNLLGYSKNYRKTTGSLWNYHRDEPNSSINGGINYSIVGSKSFDYKANFIEAGVTQNSLIKNVVKIVVPLKYLSNFWKSLNIPLINCEVELILTWFKNCVVISKATTAANHGADHDVFKIDNPKNAIFQITDTKLYVPAVALSKENDTKLLERLKTGFKITIKWNKYRSQITVQPQNNNLNYLIHPTFTNVIRLFVLSFTRNNSFNVLIDGKSFFDLQVKNEEEAYKEIINMSNNNKYTTGNLLDFVYFKKNCRLIVIDLSKQTKLKGLKQINFIGKLKKDDGALSLKNQKKQLFIFHKILSRS